EIIIQEIEDRGDITLDQLMQIFDEDESMKNLLTEIALTQETHTLKFAEDCIFHLKRRRLQRKAQEVQEMIRNEADSEDSVEHYSRQIIQIRQEINKLDKERRKHLKV
ncbi:MAG: hypothetical protein P8X42_11315, partial [Calditrichaceae bacterium]